MKFQIFFIFLLFTTFKLFSQLPTIKQLSKIHNLYMCFCEYSKYFYCRVLFFFFVFIHWQNFLVRRLQENRIELNILLALQNFTTIIVSIFALRVHGQHLIKAQIKIYDWIFWQLILIEAKCGKIHVIEKKALEINSFFFISHHFFPFS